MLSRPAPRILVVDDNPPTRYSTSRVLRSARFDVLEAPTGMDALRLSRERPDLVILDVNLPDIDGFEVCRRLRADPVTARTPVIHLSATLVDADAKVQGLEAGADGYLTHPVEPPVLVATVNAFLRARHAEEAMRSSEAKFKAVFENAVNGIALLTDGMVYLEVNDAVATTLGRRQAEVVGKHISVFVPPHHEAILAAIDEALATHGSWRGVCPVLHADGHSVDLEWTVSLHSGAATRLAITTDISEQRALAAERERLLDSERAARAEAERANQLKNEFLAAVSHELRTPLNAILGWTRMIRPEEPAPNLAKGIDAIERNVRVQTQMIADLLDVSRIATGKLRLDLQPFEPQLVLDASLTPLAAAAESKNLTIEVTVDPALKELVWDLARFQQVVSNLVDNAMKFSEPGGLVRVSLTREGEGTRLTVQDTGKGIAADFLPHVFDRFRQEDAGSRRRHRGLGLGLAIVKQIVEAHSGTVAAESPGEGQGATFSVFMPPLKARAEVDVDRKGGDHRTLEGLRILVVDDDQDALDLVTRVLGEFRAEVRGALDVPTARVALRELRPNLVVSDISMPDEDGFDLIRFMRGPGSDWAGVPAVALTAFARDEDRKRILAAGYQDHLAKPVDTLKLIETASRLGRPHRKGEARNG